MGTSVDEDDTEDKSPKNNDEGFVVENRRSGRAGLRIPLEKQSVKRSSLVQKEASKEHRIEKRSKLPCRYGQFCKHGVQCEFYHPAEELKFFQKYGSKNPMKLNFKKCK